MYLHVLNVCASCTVAAMTMPGSVHEPKALLYNIVSDHRENSV